MGKDVLEDRYYDGEGPASALTHMRWNVMTQRMAQHILDCQAEVVRLRAQRAELTEEENTLREYARINTESAVNIGWTKAALRDFIAICDRLCPPKDQPTLAELADKLAKLLPYEYGQAEKRIIGEVVDALRARGDK